LDEDETRFLLVYVPEEGLNWDEMEALAIERCNAEADEFHEFLPMPGTSAWFQAKLSLEPVS